MVVLIPFAGLSPSHYLSQRLPTHSATIRSFASAYHTSASIGPS